MTIYDLVLANKLDGRSILHRSCQLCIGLLRTWHLHHRFALNCQMLLGLSVSTMIVELTNNQNFTKGRAIDNKYFDNEPPQKYYTKLFESRFTLYLLPLSTNCRNVI